MVSTVEQPFKATIISKTVANGSVVPRKEIAIKPQVSGIVDKLMVEAGDKVTKGQVLARVRVIPNMVQLNNAENRVKQAQIDFDNQKQEYDRQKELFDDEVIPLSSFQDVQASYERSSQELEAAKDNLQIIKEGALKKAGAVQNTLIRSTAKGMVLDVPVKAGNQVIEAGLCSALEVGTIDRSDLRDPRCADFNWIDFPGANSKQLFWVAQPDEGIDRFGVYWGGELLRTCRIDANVCRIELPG